MLVVEDSLTIRQRFREVLASDPELEVVGDAEDGEYGIELCRELRLDVVSLDMLLLVMSELTATEYSEISSAVAELAGKRDGGRR